MEDSQQTDNEYMNILILYMDVVDTLLHRDMVSDNTLCVWTKDNAYANFTVSAFKVVLRQHGRGDNYRYYMRIFRTFGWIICKKEKFSNVQWINGKSIRVVSVDYKKYKLLKILNAQNNHDKLLEKYIRVIDKLIYLNNKTEKCLYISSKNETILKIKSSNFKFLLQKECNDEYENYMILFRSLEWIFCDEGKFSTVQKIDGKPTRVIAVDFEKYKLMKKLIE